MFLDGEGGGREGLGEDKRKCKLNGTERVSGRMAAKRFDAIIRERRESERNVRVSPSSLVLSSEIWQRVGVWQD